MYFILMNVHKKLKIILIKSCVIYFINKVLCYLFFVLINVHTNYIMMYVCLQACMYMICAKIS